MKSRLLFLIFVFSTSIYSQAEFKVKAYDFIWLDIESSRQIDILIFLKVTNIGNQPDKCTDLYKIKLASTEIQYKYGTDIKFQKMSSDAEEIINPAAEIYATMTFRVPKGADNLTLYFTEDAGGDVKFLTESYNKWILNNKDYKKFTDEGQSAFSSGDYVNAVVNYYKALLINPKLQLNFAMANAWIMLGDYENAITYYKKSLNDNVDKSIVYNNLGYALFEKGYYQDAIDNFSKAIEIDKKHWDAILGAAIASYELYEIEDAKILYEYAAKIENKLYRGIEGLYLLMDEQSTFYTDKQVNSINSLCKLLGYISY